MSLVLNLLRRPARGLVASGSAFASALVGLEFASNPGLAKTFPIGAVASCLARGENVLKSFDITCSVVQFSLYSASVLFSGYHEWSPVPISACLRRGPRGCFILVYCV